MSPDEKAAAIAHHLRAKEGTGYASIRQRAATPLETRGSPGIAQAIQLHSSDVFVCFWAGLCRPGATRFEFRAFAKVATFLACEFDSDGQLPRTVSVDEVILVGWLTTEAGSKVPMRIPETPTVPAGTPPPDERRRSCTRPRT